MSIKKLSLIFMMVFITILSLACNETNDKSLLEKNSSLFPKGQLAPAKFFTGNAWVTGLVDNDSVFTTAAGSVFLKPVQEATGILIQADKY